MRDEEQSGARKLVAKACIVHRSHHRLASARCSDEQVAMMSLLASNVDLFEQMLLERIELDLDGTEQEQRIRS